MKFTFEHALYLIAILLALAVRFFYLGEYSLQENEAQSALNALNLLQADQSVFSLEPENPQPAYLTLTWFAFEILGGQTAIARLWPALAGAMLILVPLLFKSVLGRPGALVLAFILALSPGLIVVSRQADGRMMALAFTLFAVGLAWRMKIDWAGVFLGLALLSGPTVIPGLLGAVLALVMGELSYKVRQAGNLEDEINGESRPAFPISFLRGALLPAGLTLFLVATMFFLYPQGLSNWVAALPAYFRGWLEPSGVPALRLVVALLVYQPLVVIFGLAGALRGLRRSDPLSRGLVTWFLISLVLSLAYPARQVSDLIWSLIPLMTLAALEISQFLVFDRGDERIPAGMAALVLLMMTTFWFNLLGLGPFSLANQEVVLRTVVMLGILLLVALSTVLIGMGWSWFNAGRGLVWGLCLALGIYGLSNVGESLQRPFAQNLNLWHFMPASGDTDLFLQTIADLSAWNTGRDDGLEIQVAVDSASLQWLVRDRPDVTFIPASQVASIRGTPPLLVTRQSQAELNLAADYRGQDFSWWVYPDWSGSLPPNLANWIAFRRTPQRQEQIILWARNDLFLGQSSLGSGDDQTSPQIISPEEIGP